jgi:hypothetical protein
MVLQGQCFDGGGLEFHAASSRTVWLRQHATNGVACLDKVLQRNCSKFGRAGKQNAHAVFLALFAVAQSFE